MSNCHSVSCEKQPRLCTVKIHVVQGSSNNEDLVMMAMRSCLLSAWSGMLTGLEEASKTETFLDKLFGTDCYSRSLQTLGNDCGGLSQPDKSRLAFGLTACHLQQLGQPASECHRRSSLKQCADDLDDRGYSTYLKFLAEIDRWPLSFGTL